MRIPAKQSLLWDWQIVKYAHLEAINRPQIVFYDLWLEKWLDRYRVRKTSGIAGRKPDRRSWSYDSPEAAMKAFDRILNSKTNLDRKAPRKYRLFKMASRREMGKTEIGEH